MSKSPETLLKLGILDALENIKYLQELIDEWNDPKDIAQRAAVLLQKTHNTHSHLLWKLLVMLQNNCKHPKKMRDLCADGTVYCMDCNDDLSDNEIMSIKTPTLIKQKVQSRRKLVLKCTKNKLKQAQIAKKLNVSLSTIEKDLVVLRNDNSLE